MVYSLHISPWRKWEDRKGLPEQSGVYIVAKNSPENVIYIGLTSGQGGLRKRVAAFHRAATKRSAKHAGGLTYNGIFGSDVSRLFVAVHVPVAINPAKEISSTYIKYAERRLIWEFVEKHGKLPACNSE